MMSPVNRAKVAAAQKSGRRMVGGIYKRTRADGTVERLCSRLVCIQWATAAGGSAGREEGTGATGRTKELPEGRGMWAAPAMAVFLIS